MLHVSKNQHQGVWNKESLISEGVESLKNPIKRQNEISLALKDLLSEENYDLQNAKITYSQVKKIAKANSEFAKKLNDTALEILDKDVLSFDEFKSISQVELVSRLSKDYFDSLANHGFYSHLEDNTFRDLRRAAVATELGLMGIASMTGMYQISPPTMGIVSVASLVASLMSNTNVLRARIRIAERGLELMRYIPVPVNVPFARCDRVS